MRLPAAKLRVTPRETTTLRFYASAARIRQTWSFRGPGRFRFLRPEPARGLCSWSHQRFSVFVVLPKRRHVGSTAALFLSVFMQQRALIVPVGDQ